MGAHQAVDEVEESDDLGRDPVLPHQQVDGEGGEDVATAAEEDLQGVVEPVAAAQRGRAAGTPGGGRGRAEEQEEQGTRDDDGPR